MARYDTSTAWFKSPRGKSALMYIREETNDFNTCQAAMTEDEYGLADLHLTGTAIDIGGHIGAVTISLLLDNPDLKVETVEPIPANIGLIVRNADVNGVRDRLTIHAAAAGDGEPVTVRYAYMDNENDLHHAFIGNSLDPSFASEERAHSQAVVPTLTPADLPLVSFIKIDCEGGEWPFFAQPMPRPWAPVIRGEWHPTDGHVRDDLVALLAGYDVTFSGPEGGPGGFHATLRTDAGGS